MARDRTEQSALTPARNTRSQSRLTQQDGHAQPSSQDSSGPAGDETSFNMMITSETFLLDTNESFAAHMMRGNSAGDVTFAAPAPPSPKRRGRGRRTPSPVKAPKAFDFAFRKPSGDATPDTEPRAPAEASDAALRQPSSSLQRSAIRDDGMSEGKPSMHGRTPFPVATTSAESSGLNAEEGDALRASSSDVPTGSDSNAKSGSRRKSLIARPVSARIPLPPPSAPSNAWLYRKPSQFIEPTAPASSLPAASGAEGSGVKISPTEPSDISPQAAAEATSAVAEPAAPTLRKIVKLKRTGLTRVSRSGNSGVLDSQTSSNDANTSDVQHPDKVSPISTPSPVAPAPQEVSHPVEEPLKVSTQGAPSHPAEKETSPLPEAVSISPEAATTAPKESDAETLVAPAAQNLAESSQEEIALVEPPPRIAAHVPKPLTVVSIKPKRPRPATKDDVEPVKDGGAAQNLKKDEESKPKRIKTDHPVKPDRPKADSKAFTSVGRGLPSTTAVRPISKEAPRVKGSRTFSAPTTASGKRVPLADRGQQRSASNTTKPDKALKEGTVPHAFTFESDRRLDLKKAVQQAKEKPPAKVVLQTFKPAHHPATLDKPTAASLSRALATVSQSENQPLTGGKDAPKKTSTLATNAKFQPTVPQAPKFATDERMKERSAFDEALRMKEEERRKTEEAEQEAEERRKEEEVKELRKVLDDTAKANVHPVPEWYKERPKLKKETDSAGISS